MRLSPPLKLLLRNPSLFEKQTTSLPLLNSLQYRLPVFDPSRNFPSGTIIGETTDFTSQQEASDVVQQLAKTSNTFFHSTWIHTTTQQRSQMLLRIASLQRQHIHDLATILSCESGKPIKEAMGEVEYAAGYFQFFGEETKRNYGKIIPSPIPNRELKVTREPVGTAFLLTPFNFPVAMLSRKLAAALAAGCTAICRPSEDVPLSAIALRYIATEAGVPEEAFYVCPSTRTYATTIADTLCTSPYVQKISFTGSTAVGKSLVEKCAAQLKRTSMELGGNAPFIVFEDANLDHAVTGLLAAKLRFSGQTCVAANRVFIHSSLYEKFVTEYIKRVSKLKLGPSLAESTDLGPLIHERAVKKVRGFLTNGGTIKGVVADDPQTLFIHPKLIVDINVHHPAVENEIFGPICGVIPFNNENEVIEMANQTTSGLAGYFYTQDLSRAYRVGKALKCGMLGLNTGFISTELAPFGGVKESGIGREGSWLGMDDYSDWKYIAVQN
jgi:succinate-semialdehyde dehydrogenase/glutarate-semialdehyde dehydrogenase